MAFNENIGEIWNLVVSDLGHFFISSSNDKSLKKWEQTRE
jgi:hypothetical protein